MASATWFVAQITKPIDKLLSVAMAKCVTPLSPARLLRYRTNIITIIIIIKPALFEEQRGINFPS